MDWEPTYPDKSKRSDDTATLTTHCYECRKNNYWPHTGFCYWCSQRLCSSCDPRIENNSANDHAHFCASCGRKRTACIYPNNNAVFCELCGKNKNARVEQAVEADAMEWVHLFNVLPDLCLLRIFNLMGSLRDVMSCANTCHKWRYLINENGDKAIWNGLCKDRWPTISARLLSSPRVKWRDYYILRHSRLNKDKLLIAVEDSVEGRCMHYLNFETIPAMTNIGYILKAKMCPGCDKYVVKCESADQTSVLIHHGLLCHSQLGERTSFPAAFHLAKTPSPELDWGFADWYFGEISREKAGEILKGAPYVDGLFLVRKNLIRPNEFCISLLYNRYIEHVRINQDGEGFRIGLPYAFQSIPLLIEYYQKNSLAMHFSDVETPLTRSPSRPSAKAHYGSTMGSCSRCHNNPQVASLIGCNCRQPANIRARSNHFRQYLIANESRGTALAVLAKIAERNAQLGGDANIVMNKLMTGSGMDANGQPFVNRGNGNPYQSINDMNNNSNSNTTTTNTIKNNNHNNHNHNDSSSINNNNNNNSNNNNYTNNNTSNNNNNNNNNNNTTANNTTNNNNNNNNNNSTISTPTIPPIGFARYPVSTQNENTNVNRQNTNINPQHTHINSQHQNINPQHTNLNRQHLDINSQHTNFNPQHTNINPQHTNINPQHQNLNSQHTNQHQDINPQHQDQFANSDTQRGLPQDLAQTLISLGISQRVEDANALIQSESLFPRDFEFNLHQQQQQQQQQQHQQRQQQQHHHQQHQHQQQQQQQHPQQQQHQQQHQHQHQHQQQHHRQSPS